MDEAGTTTRLFFSLLSSRARMFFGMSLAETTIARDTNIATKKETPLFATYRVGSKAKSPIRTRSGLAGGRASGCALCNLVPLYSL